MEAGGPTGVAVQGGVGSGGTFRAGGPAVQRRGGTAERREREVSYGSERQREEWLTGLTKG